MGDETYASCEAIEGELFWNSDQNAYCCCFDYGDFGSVKVFPLEQGEFPLERYLEWRNGMRARHRRGEISSNCRSCCRLQTRRWPDDETCRLRVLTLTHFKSCNLACTFCGNRSLRANSSIEEVDVRAILRDMVARGLFAPDAQIMIAGGEASTWPHFDEVLQILLPLRLRFLVCTNAVRYLPVLDHLWDAAGRVEVVCGIHAASRTTHRSLVGGGDVFEAVWKNFARYVTAGGAFVRGKMVLLPQNVHEAESFVDRCVDVGARAVDVASDNKVSVPDDAVLAATARFYRRACDHGLRLTWGDRLLIVRGQDPVRWQKFFDAACRIPGGRLIPGGRSVRVEHAGRNERAKDAILYLSHVDTAISGFVEIERHLVGSQGTQPVQETITARGRSLMFASPGSFVELFVPGGVVRLTFITNQWAGRARILVDGTEAGTIDMYHDGLYSRVREVSVDLENVRLPGAT
jgi:pyruvate-formate lyase-activating enzyme